MRAFPSVLVDEAHSPAWTIRPEVAEQVNPVKPADASYARAADALRARGHRVGAHSAGPLDEATLAGHDVLVLPHSSDPVSYTHLTLPTTDVVCRSRWSPDH